MSLERIASISFPRSGHYALTAVLRDYFGEDFKYCDNYTSEAADRMEVNPLTNFQKEHDLLLTYSPIMGVKHLIQVRNPIHAIQSWIDFDAVVTGINANQSQDEWRRVFSNRILFWRDWYEKWVLSSIEPRLIVEYEKLVAAPVATLQHVILFMTNGKHAKESRLNEALNRFPIERREARKSNWILSA